MKIIITAICTFEGDTDDADQELGPADQAHEIVLQMLPRKADLEEVVEWTPAS